MAKTQHADFRFTVKEGSGGAFIALEPVGSDLKILGSGFLTLHIAEHSTVESARAIADLLNEKIVSVAYTSF